MGGVINGFPTDVGSILVMMGACSEEQVKHASETEKKGASVAGILLEQGTVTKDDVDEAERLRDSLRSATGEMPVVTLVRLYDHAVSNYHRSTLRLSETLESLSRR